MYVPEKPRGRKMSRLPMSVGSLRGELGVGIPSANPDVCQMV